MPAPQTRYAQSGEIGIAYQVVGEGEMDVVVAFPFVSHLDLVWESPALPISSTASARSRG